MREDLVSEELVKIARLVEAGGDNVFFVKQGNTYTLWVSYAPNSGTVAVFKGKIDTYLTDKSSDSNYDHIVPLLAKNLPANKVVTIPIYDYVSDAREYDINGGSLKPSKKAYATMDKGNITVVGFFSRAGEAKNWLKMKKSSIDARFMRDAQNLMTSAETKLGDLEMLMMHDEFSDAARNQLFKANAEIRKLAKIVNNDMRRLRKM